jgi:CubicO group peptidase (beta-lactamase class C family)
MAAAALPVRPVHAAGLEDQIGGLARPFLQDKKYLCMVVGVLLPEERHVFAYGQYTLGGTTVVPNELTIFEIGSISKVFTGTMLAQLVRDGVVKLEDPVQKHLPPELQAPKRGGHEMTLLDLATHYSGLPVQPTNLAPFLVTTPTRDWGNPYLHYQLAHVAQNLRDIQLERDPGSKFEYSNLGAGVLGHALVHAVHAASYEDLLVRRITQPLLMRDTLVHLNTEQQLRWAPGHTKIGFPAPPWDFSSLEGCGGIRSTVHDMLTFAAANLGEQETTLGPALRLAHQPRRDTEMGDRIGLFWLTTPWLGKGREVLFHNGGTGGYRSFLGLVPATKTAVVILSNSPHNLDDLGVQMLRAIQERK